MTNTNPIWSVTGEGNLHVLRRSADATRTLVTRPNIGITGSPWRPHLVIKAHMSSVHLCLEARKQNKWSKQKIVPLGCCCYLLQVWVHGKLIHIHVGVQHVPVSCKRMNYLIKKIDKNKDIFTGLTASEQFSVQLLVFAERCGMWCVCVEYDIPRLLLY